MSAPRFHFFAAVYLIALKNGKVLLARRYNTGWKDGMYTLPAGHVDGNETVHVAMSREAKEETDLDIVPEDLKVVHIMHRNSGDREYFDFFLETRRWGGEPKNTEPHKCDHLDWFDIHALPDNTLEYVAVVLKKWNQGLLFSNFGFESI